MRSLVALSETARHLIELQRSVSLYFQSNINNHELQSNVDSLSAGGAAPINRESQRAPLFTVQHRFNSTPGELFVSTTA